MGNEMSAPGAAAGARRAPRYDVIKMQVTCDWCAVRERPEAAAKLIRQLPKATVVDLVEEKTMDDSSVMGKIIDPV